MAIRAFFSVRRAKRQIKTWLYNTCPGHAGWMSYFGERLYFPRNCHLVDRVIDSVVYEADLVQAISRIVAAGGVYFDVGANIGLLAIPVLKKNQQVKVHSFEPSPGTYRYLEATHKKSSFRDRWSLVNVALGAVDGTTSFFVHDEANGAFDGIADTGRAGSSREVQVQLTKLDTYWNSIDRPKVSCIKIDVEGFEADVLSGASETLAACRPIIFLEWCASNLRFGTAATALLRIAGSLRYRVYSWPACQKVDDATDLELSMRFTQAFVLAPSAV